jgi:hypothetical protein
MMVAMTKLATALAAVTVSALLALGAPAYASHGGDDPAGDDHGGGGGSGGGGTRVVKTGACSDGAHWKLKVKSDDGRLEVEGEVDSNVSGQTWSWRIKDNGSVAASGSAKTGGRSGSFSVERRITDRAGTDNVIFRATHSGEVCKGSIAF